MSTQYVVPELRVAEPSIHLPRSVAKTSSAWNQQPRHLPEGPTPTAPHRGDFLPPSRILQDAQEADLPSLFLLIMSLILRRGIASMASLKKAPKVVCIGRNYAYVLSLPLEEGGARG